MSEGALSINLATAESLVTEGERLIARHRRIIEALESQAGVNTETMGQAREVLASAEALQARRIANLDLLRRQLARTKTGME